MTGDTPPPPPELSAAPAGQRERPGGRLNKWTLGGLLMVDIALLLTFLALANVTAEGPAKRTLTHSIAILTEVDALLDADYEDLRIEASLSDGDVALADFPIALSFTPQEVLESDRVSFRELLLLRAAERVHADGVDAFRSEGDDGIRLVSTEGTLRAALDFLRPAPHRVMFGITLFFAAIALLLTAGLMFATRGYGRMLAVGLSVLIAATPFLAAAVALRFALRVGADGVDDYVSQQFFQLSQELAWAPIRNGIIFCAAGGILFVTGSILCRWSDDRRARRVSRAA